MNTEKPKHSLIIEDDYEDESLKILKEINWQKFHKLCKSIGNELNGRQWRFLKAVFLENAVAKYSNNMLTYVGDTEEGCDLKISSLDNLKIEMKYVEGCLFNTNKLTLNKETKEIKLLNSNGTNTHLNLPDTYSDYLLIVDLNGAALISKNELRKYVKSKGDSLVAKIPTDKLKIIFNPSDIDKNIEKKDLHIMEQFMNTINNIIENV